MKKSLNINATRNGKKVSTSIGYVNPDVANSIAGGFAQMVNALTTNTFVNAEVVKKMDTTEEEQQSGGGSSGSATNVTLTVDTYYSDGAVEHLDSATAQSILSYPNPYTLRINTENLTVEYLDIILSADAAVSLTCGFIDVEGNFVRTM